jgi:RNA polymerase sigma-70 factor, ECF subfamily
MTRGGSVGRLVDLGDPDHRRQGCVFNHRQERRDPLGMKFLDLLTVPPYASSIEQQQSQGRTWKMSATQSQSNEPDRPGLPDLNDDLRLVEALRRGDEDAYVSLVDRYHASMIRVAMIYVHDRSTAEDVVQETWLGVLQGIHRFEGRSSLRTWMFHILKNRARTRARREGRTLPFSALGNPGAEEPAVDPDRFLPASHPRWPHHWASFPQSWNSVEGQLMSQESRACVTQVVTDLPPRQREVITLRDIEGWTSEEVCNVLGISETNQRVLLHRARSRARRALEQLLREE